MKPTCAVPSQIHAPTLSRAPKRAGCGKPSLLVALAGLVAAGLTPRAFAEKPSSPSFDLVVASGVARCLPNARGEVRLRSHGPNQEMEVSVSGLPAHNTFTVFVLQLPHSPFGLSWYQGDVETDEDGTGRAKFTGIFSNETFIVAPGPGPAPVEHPQDASTNPQTAPVHTLHLGMWFDSTAEAAAANCPTGQTPFNGDHTAGVQVLNTTNFPDGAGPLGQFGDKSASSR
jgi:hypothetical protein